jgi:hypothetical protein
VFLTIVLLEMASNAFNPVYGDGASPKVIFIYVVKEGPFTALHDPS